MADKLPLDAYKMNLYMEIMEAQNKLHHDIYADIVTTELTNVKVSQLVLDHLKKTILKAGGLHD